MNKVEINGNNTLMSFIEDNRTKIDESLVSLRFMKQIDVFLDNNNLNQRDLASDLAISEAFVSQLMTGSKKVNVSFLNKIEKKYDIEFKVSIKNKNSKYKVIELTNSPTLIKLNTVINNDISYSWSDISKNSYSFKSDNIIEILNNDTI